MLGGHRAPRSLPLQVRIGSYRKGGQPGRPRWRNAPTVPSQRWRETSGFCCPGAAPVLARADREHGLGPLSALPGEAAAAMDAGQPDRGVQLLEQARGVLVADTLDAAAAT